jgi:hypothetical protein
MEHETYVLPLQIVGKGDVLKLKRELVALDEYVEQLKMRQADTAIEPHNLPKTSSSLNELSSANHLKWHIDKDRTAGIDFLNRLIEHAPLVHISFASEPTNAFMRKIDKWFRDNIDPYVLINVGLEPSIAAGFTLQTDNKYHDFSLREHFLNRKVLLMKSIKGNDHTPETT